MMVDVVQNKAKLEAAHLGKEAKEREILVLSWPVKAAPCELQIVSFKFKTD